jgi:hypothetical protein
LLCFRETYFSNIIKAKKASNWMPFLLQNY